MYGSQKLIIIITRETIRAIRACVAMYFPSGFGRDLVIGSHLYFCTREIGSPSVDGDVKEEPDNIYKVSISCGCFKSKVVVGSKVKEYLS